MNSPFDGIPPFPEGLPLAPIAIISHAKLLDGDNDEAVRLLTAAKTHGFLYLNLQDTPQGKAFLAEADQLHAVAKEAFALPLHEKLPHALERGVSLFGYKAAGTVKTTDRDQRRDTTEFFCVSKDYVHNIARENIRGTPITYPPEITTHTPLFQSFTRRGHECGLLVLRTLASQLGLPADSFDHLNRFDQPSGDHCRLTHKPPSPPNPDGSVSSSTLGLPSHTDFGSVTVLFNWLGGLQVESHIDTTSTATTDGREGGGEGGEVVQREWQWVKPLPGHAIVNLGDAMVTFTNGALKSAKHRVVPSPGEQAGADRYSVVYFVRPHNDVPMRALAQFDDRTNKAGAIQVAGKFSADLARKGEVVLTAGEWMRQRGIQLGN
ncbi:hypothetical protein F5144DRAFT_591748 [Chaetomium tenue]|uniref:Uncharacterized protein n=1 Tax=Chaetomium tenue TaxID=1854479 RepID=A0ACB7PEH9_9PEZI|nr:hypothetical protein F5144DRAFT_591748 [Chaetomium globosum]